MVKKIRYLILITGIVLCSHLWADGSGKWQSPETVDGTQTVSLEQAKLLHAQGVVFIDVRSVRQYNKRHIPGAINLYINNGFTEANLLKHVKKDTDFVIYCNGAHCSLSYKSAKKAVAWGFSGVKYFREGIRAWRLGDNPLEYGAK